ncbi:MAG TPA: glycoside hydrolase family 3 N-terminal domain-containing protein [Solirubrobacterales bacterium]|nr:glycoside hydrolase family 3 N-terminal domain-containing protein [Solirubrobacterales bacterium]
MSRAGAAGVALAAVAAGLALSCAWGREPRAAPAAEPSAAAALTPRQLAGQRVVCGFDGRRAPRSLLRVAERGELAGVILFEDNVRSRGQVARLAGALQATRRPEGLRQPVIVSVDQEGGLVKRLPGPPQASAAVMGARGPAFARGQGEATGASLAAAGINVDLAPVLDVARPGGFIADQRRAFGSKPGRVARAGTAFAEGLQAAGVAATAKHFPGLGATADNTDLRPSSIRLGAGTLRRVDERPYESFAAAGGRLVMVSSARYPRLGAGMLPASQSRRITTGELRGRLGFTGVSITDSLETPGARGGSGDAKVAVRAAAAGSDLLLYVHCDAAMRAATALRRAVISGTLDRASFERSVERVLALRGSL